jgi:hypothetical protein
LAAVGGYLLLPKEKELTKYNLVRYRANIRRVSPPNILGIGHISDGR